MQSLRTRGRWLRPQQAGLLIAAAVFVVVALPLLRFAFTHWNDFQGRVNAVNIMQAGWLQQESAQTGRSILSLLAGRLVRGWLAVAFHLDISGFYNDTAPMLQFWPALLFGLGIGVCLLRARRPLPLLLVLWFFGLGALGGGLTETVPSYSRLSGLAPALATIIAVAIVALAHAGRRIELWSSKSTRLAVALLVLVLGISSTRFYFADFQARADYGGNGAELMTQVGAILQERPPGFPVYFLGLPRMFHDFPTRPFMAPHVVAVDMPGPGQPDSATPPPGYDPARPAFFFAIPEREADLRLLARNLPGGVWMAGKRRIDGTPLWFGYDVPAGAVTREP